MITALVLYVTGSFASLSQGPLQEIRIFGKNIFDFLDMLASNFLLPVGGLLLCIAVGFIWKPKNALQEITNRETIQFRMKNIWVIAIKYVMPVCIIFIMLDTLGIL